LVAVQAVSAQAQWVTNGTNINNTNTGNVGISNPSPFAKLTIGNSTDRNGSVLIEGVDTAPHILFNSSGYNRGRITTLLNGIHFQAYSGSFLRNDLFVRDDGNVGIGNTTPTAKLHVAGDVRVDGNISAKYQDVAEWVPSREKLSAGTVVILDIGHNNHVAASSTPYDTRVAGVVSAQPGLSLGEAGEGKALVATTGRVKVKVDATRAPIKIGDLLVTSEMAGVAMRSQPLELGGVQLHRPGTLIGKALEPLEKGTGEILVLLSLQ
jgi:hypothetical protein